MAGSERDVVPCFAVLQDVVTGLGALFGGPANHPRLNQIRRSVVARPTSDRALVLAASELVSHRSVATRFRGGPARQIVASLAAPGPNVRVPACGDNGSGFIPTTAQSRLRGGCRTWRTCWRQSRIRWVAGWTGRRGSEFPLSGFLAWWLLIVQFRKTRAIWQDNNGAYMRRAAANSERPFARQDCVRKNWIHLSSHFLRDVPKSALRQLACARNTHPRPHFRSGRTGIGALQLNGR